MTACCPEECKIGTSFFYKMLVSIKQIQSLNNKPDGVSLEELAKHMEETYCLSGDIRSQLEHSLSIAQESRLLIKKKKYYSLICPAANIHLIPTQCVKAKLEKIEHSFSENKHRKRVNTREHIETKNSTKRKRNNNEGKRRSKRKPENDCQCSDNEECLELGMSHSQSSMTLPSKSCLRYNSNRPAAYSDTSSDSGDS
ncbi:unnamed protein product [Diabrotica balteata]|uniref:Uncharacterized protein n=1 Tax=Diabrotica balteata TaxID=107213 RepID=A0A9P0GZN0_DIABA|nr:unnamed protein product [Diabrotica balteata]